MGDRELGNDVGEATSSELNEALATNDSSGLAKESLRSRSIMQNQFGKNIMSPQMGG